MLSGNRQQPRAFIRARYAVAVKRGSRGRIAHFARHGRLPAAAFTNFHAAEHVAIGASLLMKPRH